MLRGNEIENIFFFLCLKMSAFLYKKSFLGERKQEEREMVCGCRESEGHRGTQWDGGPLL